MSELRSAVYTTPRRKQACQRCHTKRIKCLGGVPCRNCVISAALCTFPPPRKSRTVSNTSVPILPTPIVQEQVFETSPIPASPSNAGQNQYRRNEKDFASSRSSTDPRRARPNYRGDPSCPGFVQLFTTWVVSLKDELTRNNEAWFDPSWSALGHDDQHVLEPSLEISIDTVIQEPIVPRQGATKPVTIRLPPYNHSVLLIQVLENTIGHEQHYFRRKDLRTKVWQMHQNPASAQSKDQGWLCHWLAILALGELYNNGAVATTEDAPPGIDYYSQCVSLLPQVADTPDIQYIATLCLLCLFAFCMNRPNTAYMYVGVSLRAALALSLHRDPNELHSDSITLSETEIEHQKRLFWTVYFQDLLTTTTIGRPWGVLDDEISVGYGASTLSTSDILLDFFDADEANQHLELMRLRSQATSSLYGYAGTAINPQSHICLLNYELGEPLTAQHLDKMTEFYESLVAWESELSTAMKIAPSWDNSLVNLNRVNANLYLIYHQAILVILRPALVDLFNQWFDNEMKSREVFSTSQPQAVSQTTTRLLMMYSHSLQAARSTSMLSQWLFDQGALLTYSYNHASYLFTAAMVLYIARAMSSQGTFGMYFTHEDHNCLSTVTRLLNVQATAKSPSASDFVRKLEVLNNNLQALGMQMQDVAFSGSVTLSF